MKPWANSYSLCSYRLSAVNAQGLTRAPRGSLSPQNRPDERAGLNISGPLGEVVAVFLRKRSPRVARATRAFTAQNSV
jgi:hypothetical protein